jgi:outer membrane protein TolC/ABC-type uncharacterized transport system substrate-binding protein
VLTFLFAASVGIPAARSARKLPVVRIGIVKDGLSARFPEPITLVKEEILKLTSEQFDVLFPSDKALHGNWNVSDIKAALDRLLTDPDVDLVISLGYIGSNELCHRKKVPKPVIAAIVLDRKLQNLPFKDGASGVKNLVYIDSFLSFERDIRAFRDMVPFRNLAILVSEMGLETVPWLTGEVRRIGYEYTIDLTLVEVGSSADRALAHLSPEMDAAFLFPLAQLPARDFRKLLYGLIQLRLPSFSMYGKHDVEAGVLASIAPETNLTRLARRIALNVQRILLGEEPATMKVAFPIGEKLTINMATARAIGFYPSWSTLTEAELLNEEVKRVERRLTLDSAVRQAIKANLDLAAENRNVAAGEQGVKEARSVLLPRLDLDAAGQVIDDELAQNARGLQPERSLTGSVTGTQLLYDEDAWSNYSVEKNLQTSREEQRNTVKLDITRDAAVAYLNVLRAKTLERVERDNLRLTRANYERARVRVSIGIANRSEEFRWESEIASNRSRVLEAQARTRQTENRLNRILNRPLEEKFITLETDLSDPLLTISDPRLFTYIDNPMSFRIYRDFVAEEGLEAAPELLAFDASISAQERILTSNKRAFWLPSFSAQGQVSEILAEGGEGQRGDSTLDDTDWRAGIFATFPLFEGGSKFATVKRASEELSRLQLERQATAERVEQRIRDVLHQAGASYPSIRLSREAAKAAHRNLDLVTDQYERGVVSIIDLLDAQNRALTADQRAENAVYDFLVDWMNVQRAAAQFDFFLTPAQREKYFHRLERFFEKAGVTPMKR